MQPPSVGSFWMRDERLCTITLPHFGQQDIRMHTHTSQERYDQPWQSSLVPLVHRSGWRQTLLAHLYLLMPQIIVQARLSDTSALSGAIGRVMDAWHIGKREQLIGTAQAWLYREDRLLVFS
jgi:hypothetical protein